MGVFLDEMEDGEILILASYAANYISPHNISRLRDMGSAISEAFLDEIRFQAHAIIIVWGRGVIAEAMDPHLPVTLELFGPSRMVGDRLFDEGFHSEYAGTMVALEGTDEGDEVMVRLWRRP